MGFSVAEDQKTHQKFKLNNAQMHVPSFERIFALSAQEIQKRPEMLAGANLLELTSLCASFMRNSIDQALILRIVRTVFPARPDTFAADAMLSRCQL